MSSVMSTMETVVTLMLPLGPSTQQYEPLLRLDALSTGVHIHRYIQWFVRIPLLYNDYPNTLNEMIDFWEFHYWSEHVPNDGLEEVVSLVKLCAEAYKMMVDYLLPNQYIGRLNTDEYHVEVVEKPYHTEVTINRKGEET